MQQKVQELFEEIRLAPQVDMPLLDIVGSGSQGYRPRKAIYTDVLSKLRTVMIERMVKPEEVRTTPSGDFYRELKRLFNRYWWWKTTKVKSYGNLSKKVIPLCYTRV